MSTVFHLNTGIPLDRHVRRYAITLCQGISGWTDTSILCEFLGSVYDSKHYEIVNEIAARVGQMLAMPKTKPKIALALRQIAKRHHRIDDMECYLAFYLASP
jgi:hypothetical protein